MKIIIFSFSVLLIALNSYAQNYILVGETYSAKVSKIDPVINSKVASIRVADSVGVPIPNVTKMVLDTVHNWAFIACNTANAISVIDLNTWTATYPPITVPGMGKSPKGLAINKTANRLYVANDGTNGVQGPSDPLDIISITGNSFPPTLTHIGSVPCGKQPTNVVLSHDGKYAVVSCRNQARIAVVDLTGDSVIYRYDYPSTTYEPEGLDIHPVENLVYCTTHGQNTIDLLDLNSMAIIRTVSINYTGAPPQPSGGVFSPKGNLYLLSAQTSGKMYYFNTTNPYDPIQLPYVVPSGGPQPHMAVFLNDTIAYIPNTNNTQPVGSVAIVTTGTAPANIGSVSGTWNGPLSMVLVRNTMTSIGNLSSELPDNFRLYQNYPNPFNPSTTIRFSLPQRSHVTLKIFDVLGKEVAILVNEYKEAGIYTALFDTRSSTHVTLPSGVFFYQLSIPTFFQTKSMVVIK